MKKYIDVSLYTILLITFPLSSSMVHSHYYFLPFYFFGIWTICATTLWFYSKKSSITHESNKKSQDRSNSYFIRYLFFWYFSFYSPFLLEWMLESPTKQQLAEKRRLEILRTKGIMLKYDYTWSEEAPVSAGFYWAVIKGCDRIDMVVVTENNRGWLRASIDSYEYSFDAFSAWSNKILVPEFSSIKTKKA